MTDPLYPRKSVGRWLWPLVVFLFLTVLILWLINPFGNLGREISMTDNSVSTEIVPESEWTSEPDTPAVPVQLPDTPMGNVPPADEVAGPASAATGN